MKIRTTVLSGLIMIGLAGCTQSPESAREHQEKADEAARQVGRDAYAASVKAKEAAKQAEKAAEDLDRKLDKAGEQARKGWDEAQRDHGQKQ